MANDHKGLLEAARNSLTEAVATKSDPRTHSYAAATALASIAASLLVLAEKEADRDERKEHHVH